MADCGNDLRHYGEFHRPTATIDTEPTVDMDDRANAHKATR